MAYTTINKHTDYFNTKLYTGDGTTSNAITGINFKPDWLWIKSRSNSYTATINDVVRGVTKSLVPSTTAAETTSNRVGSFNSDGFTVSTDGGSGTNGNGATFAAWNWLAGGSQGSSNTDGSINTTYTSVNTTAGFSISTYTGNTTAGATIGHGLGAVPNFIIIKNIGSPEGWIVYHSALGATQYFNLNNNSAASTSSGIFNNTEPTSSLISLGDFGSVNESPDNYVCYAFTEKRGYSHFNYYTGNGNADGTFCYTGFRPSWIMVKKSEAQDQWNMYDDKRLGYNDYNNYLAADTANGASTGHGDSNAIDILSNGFKMRGNGNAMNQANYQYVFAAFGQTLVGSNDIPNNAR